MSQTGAYVLTECVDCGAMFPVKKHSGAGAPALYCPDCKRYRHADYQREYKNRGRMKKRLAEKARRLREFLAARDAAFERAGPPVPKIEVRDGRIIETRGNVTVASWAKFCKFC